MEGHFLRVCPIDRPGSPLITAVLGQRLVPTSPQRSIPWTQVSSGLALWGCGFAGASESGVTVRPGRDEGCLPPRPPPTTSCGGWSGLPPWLLLERPCEGGGPRTKLLFARLCSEVGEVVSGGLRQEALPGCWLAVLAAPRAEPAPRLGRSLWGPHSPIRMSICPSSCLLNAGVPVKRGSAPCPRRMCVVPAAGGPPHPRLVPCLPAVSPSTRRSFIRPSSLCSSAWPRADVVDLS